MNAKRGSAANNLQVVAAPGNARTDITDCANAEAVAQAERCAEAQASHAAQREEARASLLRNIDALRQELARERRRKAISARAAQGGLKVEWRGGCAFISVGGVQRIFGGADLERVERIVDAALGDSAVVVWEGL